MTNHERAVSVIEEQLGGKPVSGSFKLPFGSAKIILHGIEKRHHVDDETEDNEPTARKPAGQNQNLRSREPPWVHRRVCGLRDIPVGGRGSSLPVLLFELNRWQVPDR